MKRRISLTAAILALTLGACRRRMTTMPMACLYRYLDGYQAEIRQ